VVTPLENSQQIGLFTSTHSLLTWQSCTFPMAGQVVGRLIGHAAVVVHAPSETICGHDGGVPELTVSEAQQVGVVDPQVEAPRQSKPS
jgi:hypothetical protein